MEAYINLEVPSKESSLSSWFLDSSIIVHSPTEIKEMINWTRHKMNDGIFTLNYVLGFRHFGRFYSEYKFTTVKKPFLESKHWMIMMIAVR